MPGLKIISTVSEDHLHSDRYYFRVVEDDSAVVEGSLMQDRASDLRHNSIGHSRDDDILDHVPGMEDRIILQKVVLAGVARDFKLSPNPDGAVELLTLLNALGDLPEVIFEVERVVVETTEADFDVKLLELHLRRTIIIT